MLCRLPGAVAIVDTCSLLSWMMISSSLISTLLLLLATSASLLLFSSSSLTFHSCLFFFLLKRQRLLRSLSPILPWGFSSQGKGWTKTSKGYLMRLRSKLSGGLSALYGRWELMRLVGGSSSTEFLEWRMMGSDSTRSCERFGWCWVLVAMWALDNYYCCCWRRSGDLVLLERISTWGCYCWEVIDGKTKQDEEEDDCLEVEHGMVIVSIRVVEIGIFYEKGVIWVCKFHLFPLEIEMEWQEFTG